jgi:hypothetical protein
MTGSVNEKDTCFSWCSPRSFEQLYFPTNSFDILTPGICFYRNHDSDQKHLNVRLEAMPNVTHVKRRTNICRGRHSRKTAMRASEEASISLRHDVHIDYR